jgi:hypothetical protein
MRCHILHAVREKTIVTKAKLLYFCFFRRKLLQIKLVSEKKMEETFKEELETKIDIEPFSINPENDEEQESR